jgi:Na+-translocating ferredoxin:NAD+ oxidoreductase subunit A
VSYLGIIVASVFASNALLSYGLGSLPGAQEKSSEVFAPTLALAIVNVLASVFLWAVRGLILSPLKLESLDILFFSLLAVPSLKLLSKAAAASGLGFISRAGAEADDLIVGSLVYGIALVSSRSGYSLPEALVASAASGLGYWLARAILESIRERLELSDLPGPFKGAPAMLISAGLIALAFIGIDAALAKNLAG